MLSRAQVEAAVASDRDTTKHGLFYGWLVVAGSFTVTCVGFGCAYSFSAFVESLPAVVMDYFGGRNVSGIIGVLYTSVGFGTLIGPSAAGFSFDLTHSYAWPIAAGIGFNVIAAAIIAVTSRPSAGQTIRQR